MNGFFCKLPALDHITKSWDWIFWYPDWNCWSILHRIISKIFRKPTREGKQTERKHALSWRATEGGSKETIQTAKRRIWTKNGRKNVVIIQQILLLYAFEDYLFVVLNPTAEQSSRSILHMKTFLYFYINFVHIVCNKTWLRKNFSLWKRMKVKITLI